MNFQTVSTAEKLPTSDGLTGGYKPGGTVPGPLLTRAWTAAHPKAGDLVVSAFRRAGDRAAPPGRGRPRPPRRGLHRRTSKIAEHGGDDPQDRPMPIPVVLPRLTHGLSAGTRVEATRIAPTILRLLGPNPQALQAVRIEHTQVLPGPVSG